LSRGAQIGARDSFAQLSNGLTRASMPQAGGRSVSSQGVLRARRNHRFGTLIAR
jgi:hypothetical protein